MDDDTGKIKKDKPSDGSYPITNNNFQDEDDEFGLREYGYQEDEEDDQKKGANDDDEDDDEKETEEDQARKLDEEYKARLVELEELKKLREERRAKELGKMKDRAEKKKKEKEERDREFNEDAGEEKERKKLIAGEKVEEKRTFKTKKAEGVFRHHRLDNFSTKGVRKIEKVARKIHGVSLDKKRKIVELLQVYNPSKSTLRKKDFNKFIIKFKSKNFKGAGFDRIKKAGINIKDARKEFGKRDIDKLNRGLTGKKDPHGYQKKAVGKRSLKK